MSFTLFVLPSTRRDLDGLDKAHYQRCYNGMTKLQKNPRVAGAKKLVGDDGYCLCVGEWQILYRIDDAAKRVYIYRIKHRFLQQLPELR